MSVRMIHPLHGLLALILFHAAAYGEVNVDVVLNEAKGAAGNIGDGKARVLVAVAAAYGANGNREKASSVLHEVRRLMGSKESRDETTREANATVLSDSAETWAILGDIESAFNDIRAIADPFWQESAKIGVAEAQARAGDFSGALATCDRMNDLHLKDMALYEIALAQADAGDFEAAIATCELIREQRDSAFFAIAVAQAGKTDVDKALQTSSLIASGRVRTVALLDIAEVATGRGETAKAREILKSSLELATKTADVETIGKVASDLAAIGDFDQANQIAQRYLQGAVKAFAMLSLSVAQAKAGQRAAATKAFNAGMAILRSSQLADSEYDIEEKAVEQAEVGEFPRAIKIAKLIPDKLVEAHALALIAVQAAKSGDSRQAMEIAGSLDDPYFQGFAYREIAAEQSKSNLRAARESFERAFEAAKMIEIGGGTDVIALYELGLAQAHAEFFDAAANTFTEARRRARKYEGDDYVGQLFQEIARSQAAGGDADRAFRSAQSESSPILKARSFLGVVEGIVGPKRQLAQ